MPTSFVVIFSFIAFKNSTNKLLYVSRTFVQKV